HGAAAAHRGERRARRRGARRPVGGRTRGAGPMTTESGRVLVVDDEPQIRRALSTNLGARGYDVLTAATGEEALRVAAERHPEVVILDLGLPGIDGVEVVRGLRGWSRVPI